MNTIALRNFKEALDDAADWKQFLKEGESDTLTYSQAEIVCLQRCFDKHKHIIINLEEDINYLRDENEDLSQEETDSIKKLERKIDDLNELINNTALPNKTLTDIEKIEVIKQYWDNITYDDIKNIINKKPENEIIILNEKIENLNYEIYQLKDIIDELINE